MFLVSLNYTMLSLRTGRSLVVALFILFLPQRFYFINGFSVVKQPPPEIHFGGGRAPGQSDQVEDGGERGSKWTKWGPLLQPTPCRPSESKLTVIQITDVYSLEHLASVKTMVADAKSRSDGTGKVVSVMTGDFLAPYLLSSVDRGDGMMNALGKIPIDYITWGNHEVSSVRQKFGLH